jgi:hypothetical protein
MSPSRRIGAWLHLTKLFLRQFLENDLIAPDSDRAQLLAVIGGGVISLTLFISMFLSATYAMSRLTPGEAAVRTLNDKFFYVSLAMLITALIAAAQWDALSLDQRDAAILDPLPVPASIVRWAKLTAVAILGGVAALVINLFPSILFPWMLAFAVPQMTAGQVFWLIGVHFMLTVTAAAFGYLAVMALRESLSALLGPRMFTRWSPSLQATMIVVVGSLLLLLPAAATRVGQRGFTGWFARTPPMVFVSAYEVVTHGFLNDLPRRQVTPRMERRDRSNSEFYEQRRPLFAPMARRLNLLLGGTVAILLIATMVSGLRAPLGGMLLTANARRRSRISELITNAIIVRHPAARAGFHFALATLFRSKTHRLTLAGAAAVALAIMLFVLSRTELEVGRLTPGILIVQPLIYGCLLIGFRHLIRVPAELRANWGVRLAWRDHPRQFRDGVCRAGLVALALPSLAISVPLVSLIGGTQAALVHAGLGALGAAIFLELVMLGYDKAPFTCNYVPGGAKALVPIFGIAFLIGANLFARLELAIINGSNVTRNVVFLWVVLTGLRIASWWRRDPLVDFDEGPETFSQLSLHN